MTSYFNTGLWLVKNETQCISYCYTSFKRKLATDFRNNSFRCQKWRLGSQQASGWSKLKLNAYMLILYAIYFFCDSDLIWALEFKNDLCFFIRLRNEPTVASDWPKIKVIESMTHIYILKGNFMLSSKNKLSWFLDDVIIQ